MFLQAYLGARRGKSFLAGSIKPEKEKSFCEKQGINHTFYQCERFMYILGKRTMPVYKGNNGFHFVGGSDWYVIARAYSEYIVKSQTPYVKQIKRWYVDSQRGPSPCVTPLPQRGPSPCVTPLPQY